MKMFVAAALMTGLLAGCSANLTPPGPQPDKYDRYYSTGAQVKTAGPDYRCKQGLPGARMVDRSPCR